MIDEEQQRKYLPLSNGFLSGAVPWISYIFAAIFGLIVLSYLPEFWRRLQAGDIIFDHWISQNWIWPIIIFDLLRSKWLSYPLYFLIVLVYLIAILSLEVSNGTLNLARGLDLGFMHWTQIVLLIGMLVFAPFLFLKSKRPL